MNPYIIDDAYYYFVIARHMAAGQGPTLNPGRAKTAYIIFALTLNAVGALQ